MSEIGLAKLTCGAQAGAVLLITACLIAAAVLINGCAPEHTAVSADGIQISFQVQGSGTPALVFVHGRCCDKTYWDARVPYFSRKHKVVAIDLAGQDREAYTTDAFGEDVAAVVEKLALDKVVLIGHSMGGPAILEVARRYASSFEAVDMSGVGHFVMNEDPETFNRLLDQAVAEFVRLVVLE